MTAASPLAAQPSPPPAAASVRVETATDHAETAALATEAFASGPGRFTARGLRWLYEEAYGEGTTVLAAYAGPRKVGHLALLHQTVTVEGRPEPAVALVDVFVSRGLPVARHAGRALPRRRGGLPRARRSPDPVGPQRHGGRRQRPHPAAGGGRPARHPRRRGRAARAGREDRVAPGGASSTRITAGASSPLSAGARRRGSAGRRSGCGAGSGGRAPATRSTSASACWRCRRRARRGGCRTR